MNIVTIEPIHADHCWRIIALARTCQSSAVRLSFTLPFL
jgi:hypothetical protein